MKKYIIPICSALMLGTSSCSESFLDLNPPTQIPTNEYYVSKAHMQELLVSAYTPLIYFDWGQNEYNPLNVMSDIMADDMYCGGSSATDNENWHLMANYSATPVKVIAGLWTSSYNGVRRCNYVEEYMPNIVDIDDDTRSLWLSEAKVLRAFYYSIVWKFWGAVPYYRENLQFPYTSAKSSADDVYSGIITDIEEAIAIGKLPLRQENETLSGRVTMAMAYMLYADVVMYQKDAARYSKALDYMKEIIASPLYGLDDDLEHLWTEAGEWNEEVIFSINYFSNGASRSWDNPYYAGGTVLPTLISPYGLASGTECNGVALVDGWGFGAIPVETYNAFEAGDKRRDASINDLRGVSYEARYQDTGLWLRKYCARSGNNEGQIADAVLNWNNDLRIYRYAETLLNAVELSLLGGGSGDIQTWFDEVRGRAGLASKPATIDNVLAERRVELLGEGKRYFDLIRSDKAQSTLVPNEYRTIGWTPNKKHLPIPQNEINSADGQLEQNTVY